MNDLDAKFIAREVVQKMNEHPNPNTKEVLNVQEVANYMGISKNSVYILVCQKKLPYYKPNGKMTYFKRSELENYLLSNRVASSAELQDKAMQYVESKDKKHLNK